MEDNEEEEEDDLEAIPFVCQGDGCSCKRQGSARPVQRVDGETGEVLEEYCSVKVASVHLNLSPSSRSGISAVCRGQQQSTGGHVFQYKFQHHRNSNGVSKPVVQLDENDNVIAEFDSITEASNILGVHETVVGKICKGRQQQTCDGLRFKYKYDGDQVGSIDDEEEEEEDETEEEEEEETEENEREQRQEGRQSARAIGSSIRLSEKRPLKRRKMTTPSSVFSPQSSGSSLTAPLTGSSTNTDLEDDLSVPASSSISSPSAMALIAWLQRRLISFGDAPMEIFAAAHSEGMPTELLREFDVCSICLEPMLLPHGSQDNAGKERRRKTEGGEYSVSSSSSSSSSSDNAATMLPCGHYFHHPCLEKYATHRPDDGGENHGAGRGHRATRHGFGVHCPLCRAHSRVNEKFDH